MILYAGFDRNQHIGFAFGDGPVNAIKRAYPYITFRLSSQKVPATWGSQWMPVWGDYSHTTIWGRFIYPYNRVIANYMAGAGYRAYSDTPPNWKTAAQWERLALNQ